MKKFKPTLTYTPRTPLSIKTKAYIIEAIEYYYDRWGIGFSMDEKLDLDGCIEINRITLEVNKHYLEKVGHKKHTYPTIDKSLCKEDE